MSQAETFYEGHSFYEGLTWSFVRERIGQGLRERYQVPNELPPKLLALVRKLDAIEGDCTRELNVSARGDLLSITFNFVTSASNSAGSLLGTW